MPRSAKRPLLLALLAVVAGFFGAVYAHSNGAAASTSRRPAGVVVTNTGQTEVSGTLTIGTAGAKNWSMAVAFGTGSEATTMTEVKASLKALPASVDVHVSVWSTTGANKQQAGNHRRMRVGRAALTRTQCLVN